MDPDPNLKRYRSNDMVVIRTASNSIRPIRIKTKIKRDPDPKSKGLGIRIRHTLSDVLYSVLVNGLT